jgi:Tol biopolymer transport system component
MNDTIGSGTRLGPYEIVSRIGAGGMGEVWKAVDTRLDRNVAIKVLPVELAQNAQFRLRFEREAKTISQLNHPNICTLHDVGEERPRLSGGTDSQPDSVSYLVMELLEGESLAERLTRGPLPVAEVLRYGAQIADALDRAHRAGVVHRDLKPGNIMLTRSGAKLLDFGLAKPSASGVFDFAPSGVTVAREDATQQRPLTTEGTIVGTFQYMAPEQLEGQDVDARTDIFAFGAVLYEMATGKPAFEGKTRTSLIAAIVRSMPQPISELQPVTPRALDHVVMKALAKDPADRWQSAHDLGDELRWIGESSSSVAAVAPAVSASRKRIAPATVLALLGLALASLFAALWLRNRGAVRHLVADMEPPAKTFFANVGDSAAPPVISPDGKYIVFGAGVTTIQLWLRTVATGEVRPLTATEGATFPFWSPDSRSIAFFTTGHLQRVDVTGGAPTQLAECAAARGGAWSPEGIIIYAQSTLTPLTLLSDRGGAPKIITKIDFPRQTTHRWPSFLPDGKHFLYLGANHQDTSGGSNAVFIGSVDGGAPRLVMNGAGNAVYKSGRLLFMRDTTLYAQKMSTAGVLSGEPEVVAEDVLNDGGIWRGAFSASDSGDLVHCTGQASIQSRLLWLDRSGKEVGSFGSPDRYWDVHFSPDRKKIVFSKGNPGRDLWIGDLESGTQTRLDLGAGVNWAGFPVWSPDGSRIVANGICEKGAVIIVTTIEGPAHLIPLSDKPVEAINGSFLGVSASPDKKSVAYSAFNSLWRINIDGGERKRLTPENIDARSPQFSPDGASLAYVSSLNGRYDVFVSRLDNMTQRTQISYNGGTNPVWRADGSELYYISADQQLMAVPVKQQGFSLTAGQPASLFRARGAFLGQIYDASLDGQRFLVNQMPDSTSVGVRLMTDWPAAMKSR